MFDQFGNDPFAMTQKREAAPVTLAWLKHAGLVDAEGVALPCCDDDDMNPLNLPTCYACGTPYGGEADECPFCGADWGYEGDEA
jgi:hypothetical protein